MIPVTGFWRFHPYGKWECIKKLRSHLTDRKVVKLVLIVRLILRKFATTQRNPHSILIQLNDFISYLIKSVFFYSRLF